MSRGLHRRATAVIGIALVLASCTSDGDDSAGKKDGFSIRDLLGEVPASVRGGAAEQGQIITGDLDLATDRSGLTRPAPDSNPTDDLWVGEWISPLTGLNSDERDNVSALLPEAAVPRRLAQNDEIIAEFGWSVLDVHSFIEVANPPATFTVLNADVTEEDLTDAIGDPDDDIWSLGGEDFEIDPDQISAARPLGESVRMALHDGLLAVSRSTPPIEDWLADDGDTLADDESLAAIASELDAAGVYAAIIISSDLTARSTPEAGGEASELLQPFDALAVGLAIDDDRNAVATFVYHHADADVAEANAEILEETFRDGVSFQTNRPFSEFFTTADVEVDGDTVVATVGFQDDAHPGVVWQMVFARDALTTHS